MKTLALEGKCVWESVSASFALADQNKGRPEIRVAPGRIASAQQGELRLAQCSVGVALLPGESFLEFASELADVGGFTKSLNLSDC
jgi:hypothetical protein